MAPHDYDVVVIGSGIGGICAAALLAHAGYKALLVERTPLLGGRCSTMENQGFKLTTGVISVSPGAAVNQVFDEVGAPFDVAHVTRLAYRVSGRDYEMPLKGSLGWLLSQVSGSDDETSKVMGALTRAFSWQEPSAAISFRDWLLQYTDNQNILDVFQSMIPAMMVINSWEVSAQTVIRFLNFARNFRVSGFAPDGNQKLMEALADVIRRYGGDVWTRCPARQILVNNGAASGVIVEKEGKQLEITARAVVSDTGPRKTVGLAGAENFEKGYLKELDDKLRPAPLTWLQTAINTPDFNHPGQLILTGTRGVNFTVCPTFACPGLAPEGKHLLLSGSAPADSLPPFDWEKEIELHIMDLRENFPEFDRYGEVLNAGCFWGEWPGSRTWAGWELPPKTPILNLYNVGDAVVRSGTTSTPAAAETARTVVDDIKKRLQPSR